MRTDPLANFSKDLQKSIHKRNYDNKLKNEENRIKEIKASPIYRMFRDRQNAKARARRKTLKEFKNRASASSQGLMES